MPFRIKPRHYLPSLLFVAFIALLPILFQESYIYHPRPYEVADLDRAKALGLKAIRYKTSQGNQTAFLYQTEDTATPPTTLWIMFSGNGSVALDWFALPWSCKDPKTAFLLVDYPSYGFCEGKPNPETILENSEKALQRLCELKSWKLGRDQLAVLGHSIGGAAALQFAAAHPVKTILVFSTARQVSPRTLAVGSGLSAGLAVHRQFGSNSERSELDADVEFLSLEGESPSFFRGICEPSTRRSTTKVWSSTQVPLTALITRTLGDLQKMDC